MHHMCLSQIFYTDRQLLILYMTAGSAEVSLILFCHKWLTKLWGESLVRCWFPGQKAQLGFHIYVKYNLEWIWYEHTYCGKNCYETALIGNPTASVMGATFYVDHRIVRPCYPWIYHEKDSNLRKLDKYRKNIYLLFPLIPLNVSNNSPNNHIT